MKIELKYKKVKIQDVKVDDYIKSFNIETNSIEPNKVTHLIKPSVKKPMKVSTNKGYVINSDIHPMMVKRNDSWVYVKTKDLEIGDMLLTSKDNIELITSVELYDVEDDFYDLTVNQTNNFFAGFETLYCGHNSATSYHMFWNWDIEKILTLKSNKSTPENSVKKLDYGIGFNKLFFDRAKNNENITLFSAEETRDLINNLYDYKLWEETYLKYENKRGIRKRKVNARKLLKTFATERFETGRYYPLFLDNVNEGPIKASIRMSNLCAEILLEVSPLEHLYDKNGLVALCILSNVNAGKIKGLDELPRLTKELVRSLDNIIDIQDYPLPAAENSTINNRYLGIGISDWAHYLTKKKVKYDSDEALNYAEEFAEHLQFNLLTASMNLAKERGEAPNFRTKSKYADGWLPNDGKWKFISHEKWEQLRKDIVEFGLRHIVLSAIPPAGTSSDYSNSTSGIDMPRDLIVTKKSKIGNFKQIVPNFAKGSQYYTLATELDNIKYLRMLSRFQLYVDQAISTNVYWTENDFVMDSNNKPKFPMKLMVRSITEAHRMGLKTTYYSTFISILDELQEIIEDGCSGGGCQV